MPRRVEGRRAFLGTAAAAGVGLLAAPAVVVGAQTPPLVKRRLGRTGFEVTTLGLGGQASLQWTGEGLVPPEIIVKAHQSGVTYFDTSNAYAKSQLHYGEAFRKLSLVPGAAGYDEKKRRSIFVASKTCVRSGRGRYPGTNNWTNGPQSSTAVDDLKRSMTQVWGDGQGGYPSGAYFDLFQVHALELPAEVDAIYEGLEKPDPKAERIGVLATLLDFRDGTNRTGLNPKEERLVRHIGVSGHRSAATLMECLQRDERGIFDTLLVAINANDRRYFSMQHNLIPVAAAKGLGVIGMKAFGDGTFYGKPGHWTQGPHEVVTSVGTPELPSAPLLRYSLSVPGVSTLIVGIGHVDDDPRRCQLTQNLAAAQLEAPLGRKALGEVEARAAAVQGGRTNYFQADQPPLGAPREPKLEQLQPAGGRSVRLTWHTAFAADQAIAAYRVLRDGAPIAEVRHLPQTTKSPVVYEDAPLDKAAHAYQLVTVDAAGRTAATNDLVAPSL